MRDVGAERVAEESGLGREGLLRGVVDHLLPVLWCGLGKVALTLTGGRTGADMDRSWFLHLMRHVLCKVGDGDVDVDLRRRPISYVWVLYAALFEGWVGCGLVRGLQFVVLNNQIPGALLGFFSRPLLELEVEGKR